MKNYYFINRLIVSVACPMTLLLLLFGCSSSGGGGNVQQQVKLVSFVTTSAGSGDLGSWGDVQGKTGLAAADVICQAHAGRAGLAGNFKAWLSDDTDDAYCRMHNLTGKKSANCNQAVLPVTAGPWTRADGSQFAGKIDQLTSDLGSSPGVYTPVWFDENGAAAIDYNYYTGTDTYGVADSSTHCANLTSNGSVTITLGYSYATKDQWTNAGGYCSSPSNHLLCMQTDPGLALQSFPTTTAKKAFLSTAWGAGDLSLWSDATGTGLAAGDAICQSLATAQSITGTFKAWLSDSTTNAKDRFTSNGPWVRLDGVKIANNMADLTDGAIYSTINLTETGQYMGAYGVFTGTVSNGTAHASTCSNWTSNSSAVHGMAGIANYANQKWTEYYDLWGCDLTIYHLYCLED